jgi:tetratricopeptide (TPR) repeat protein
MALRHRGAEHLKRCLELSEQALAMSNIDGNPSAAGHCNVFLWELTIGAGQLDRAEHFARQAGIAYEACGSHGGQSVSLVSLAWVLINRREYTEAYEHLQNALALGPLDDWPQANILATRALVAALCGHIATVEELTQEALRVTRRLPSSEGVIITLARAAQATVLSACPDGARNVLTELLGLLRNLGFQRWVADALELTAIVVAATQPAQAVTMLGAARTPRESLGESTPVFMAEAVEGCRQWAATALGNQRYSEHEQHGRSITVNDALAFALRALAAEHGPPVPSAEPRHHPPIK